MDKNIVNRVCIHLASGQSFRIEHTLSEFHELREQTDDEGIITLQTGNGNLFVSPDSIVAVEEFPTVDNQ